MGSQLPVYQAAWRATELGASTVILMVTSCFPWCLPLLSGLVSAEEIDCTSVSLDWKVCAVTFSCRVRGRHRFTPLSNGYLYFWPGCLHETKTTGLPQSLSTKSQRCYYHRYTRQSSGGCCAVYHQRQERACRSPNS